MQWKSTFSYSPLVHGGHHCHTFQEKGNFSWPFLGFHIHFKLLMASHTQKNGHHHGWRLAAALSMTILQKTQCSWHCRGSCGLVGLVWEHAKNMCMYIPPSKTQRNTKPNARRIIQTHMGSS